MIEKVPATLLACLLLFILATPGLANPEAASAMPTQVPGHNAIMVGTDWYPEQWPESRWEEDLKLMEAANIHMVRLAEFAWSSLEPSEGRYDFGWLDRAVALAAKHHIMSVLGTPTGGPPAWLTQKYPDTLRIDENGRRAVHGMRAHGSVTSPRYLEFCRKIAGQMAIHFGHNPDVVGWQIDNEYGYANMSYDDHARQLFQDWLKTKYKTLDNLNARWTTSYWSQTYDNWSEIPIPVPIEYHNPGLALDWHRFVTESWNNYQKNQIDVIRQHADPRQFITGNFMGFWDGFDHYIISDPLTFASWDDYVGTGHVDPFHNGLTHDLTRGFKRQNFWVIETQPGAVNWSNINNFLNKGEAHAMAWQAIAHGSDMVSFWQWRSALGGQEQYHGVLVGPDGTPVPFYDEVSQIGREFASLQDYFKGTTVSSDVALLNDYDSRWAIHQQKHTEKYDYVGLLESYYKQLRPLSQSIDVISPDAPLDGYKVVVAPSLNVISEERAEHLLAYVRNGGHLVLGPRSGMKDQYNLLNPERQPGYLEDGLGARVEQYYALEKDFPLAGDWGSGNVTVWAEQLKTLRPDARVLMRYGRSNGWLDQQPAAVTRRLGKGDITYIGAVLDDKLMEAAAKWMVQDSGVEPVFGPLPDGVEVSRRAGDGKQLFILINFAPENRTVKLPHTMKLLLENKQGDSVELQQYGVEIVTNP